MKHKTLRLAKRDVLDTLDRHGASPFTSDGLTTGDDAFYPTPRGPVLLMKGTKRYLARSGSRLVALVP